MGSELAIIGYGEDALTFWALKHKVSRILNEFHDKTAVSDCLIFYRPSFGRYSKTNSSVFGEFDAIIASKENNYLIESKWDNHAEFKDVEFILRKEQTLRHKVFSWYLTHWNKKYLGNWQSFISKYKNIGIEDKTIAPTDSLLSRNLEFILNKIQNRCENISESNIKNIFLFFYNSEKSTYPTKINDSFRVIQID